MLRPIRGKIKRLIGRDVSIYIRNRRRRSTVVEAHVRVDDRSRGAYLSILLSVCAVRETGNTGGNYRPVPKCSRELLVPPRVEGGRQIAPIASRGRVHARGRCVNTRGEGEGERVAVRRVQPSSPTIIFTRSRARVTIARESLNNPRSTPPRRKRVRS